ncbi:maleylacetate reductase [Homoserinimonas sp. OAct 916]|uniref:maleylacetate reductase n=1 Tax=Homoserinimonas sp. OAct 916 TaxID=2211450 RepID=UPI000DBE71E5|nr:maleylacetate reductase [Homoserinimonas sp. OAct 916]
MERQRKFEHITLGQRVLFGTGNAAEHLAGEVERLDAKRVMVITSARQRPEAERIIADIDPVLIHDEVAPHVSIGQAENARNVAINNGIDLLVSIGGGSTTGLSKAIALKTDLPIVAIPTTYAGSEATNVWGLTESSRKTTGVDDRVLPVTVIYDAALTLSLPKEVSIASGMNALAHCIDSMWAPRTDPINQALALDGIRTLSKALPAISNDPNDLAGREQALYGSYLSAVAFASAGSGLHHKICHVLGGRWNMPHAQTHAVVLPYVLAFNAPAAQGAAHRIADALSAENAVDGLNSLRAAVGAPTALKDLGLSAEGINEAVQLILPAIPASNPRRVTEENLTALLGAAHAGTSPGSMC